MSVLTPIRISRRALAASSVFIFTLVALAPSAFGQTKLGVIDVEKILETSERGKSMMAEVQGFAATKKTELEKQQSEIAGLTKRFQDGRLSLAEDVLADLQRDIEDKTINLKRAADDAERAVQVMQRERFADIEKQLLPIIDAVGAELGYSMIFNKFQSGLVYADEAVDITATVIERFDAAPVQ